MRIDTVAGHAGNQGSSVPAEDEVPKPEDLAELKAIITAHYKQHKANFPKMGIEPLDTPWYDEELNSWVLHFETGNNTFWYRDPPEGWEADQTDRGAYDGDEQYILYKPSQGGE